MFLSSLKAQGDCLLYCFSEHVCGFVRSELPFENISFELWKNYSSERRNVTGIYNTGLTHIISLLNS